MTVIPPYLPISKVCRATYEAARFVVAADEEPPIFLGGGHNRTALLATELAISLFGKRIL